MTSASEFTLPVRVYLEDTDAGGVVYHASYLRFMERARTELLRAVGLEQSKTFEQDVSFVVYGMRLRFQRPAQLDDALTITCVVKEAGAAKVVFSQEVRLPDGAVACTAEVDVACISLRSKRPRRIPADLRGALAGRTQPEVGGT